MKRKVVTAKNLHELSETYRLGKSTDESQKAALKIKIHADRAMTSFSKFNQDKHMEEAVKVADKYLETHGVEYMETKKGRAFLYANTGDTYAYTVFAPVYNQEGKYKHSRLTPFISCMGDIVEAEDYR